MATISRITASYGFQTSDYTLSQSTAANKPVYATGSMFDAQIMGSDCAVFDGSNDTLVAEVSSTLAQLPQANDYTVFTYAQSSGQNNSEEFVWNWTDDVVSTRVGEKFDSRTTQAIYKWSTQESNSVILSSSVTGSGHVGTSRNDNTTLKYTSMNVAGSDVAIDIGTPNKFALGQEARAPGTRILSGSISEVLILSRSVDDVEVEAYKRHILNSYLDPENISGMVARWKADTNVSQSTTVYSWTDSISNFIVTQSNETNKPDFIRYTDGLFNGHSYISSSDVTDVLYSQANTTIANAFSGPVSGYFIFDRVPGTNQFVFSMHDDGTEKFEVNIISTNRLEFNIGDTTNGVLAYRTGGQTITTTGSYVIVFAFNGTNNMSASYNGVLFETVGSDRNPEFDTVDHFKLLNREAEDASVGPMPEFGIFNRQLTVAEMKRITSYARLKYNVTE